MAELDTTRSGLGVLLGQVQTEGAPRPRVVTGGRSGRGVGVEFRLPAGGRRSEAVAPLREFHEGQALVLHYRAQLGDLPVDTDTWQLIGQLHQQGGTGSPPLALEVGHGQLRLASQGTHQQSLGAIAPNSVVDLDLHVVFSRDPARARVDISRDRTPVLAGYHPPGGTLLDGGDYLKLGLYRDPVITTPSALTVTEVQATRTATVTSTG